MVAPVNGEFTSVTIKICMLDGVVVLEIQLDTRRSKNILNLKSREVKVAAAAVVVVTFLCGGC